MKAKKSDIMKVYAVLEQMSKGVHPIKFSYFVAKNKKKLKDEVELLKELALPSEKFQEYDVRRAELAKSLADYDSSGRPIIRDNTYVIIKNKEEFDTKIDALKEEMEFDGHAIRMEDLPEKIEPVLIELFMDTGLLQE